MKKDHQNKYKTKRELMSNRRKRKRIVLSTDLEESDSSSSSASSTVKKRSKKSTRRNSFSSLTSSTSTSSYLTSPSSSSESGSTCSSSSSSSSDDNKTRKRKNKEIIKKKLKEKRLVEKQKRRKRRLKRRRRKIVKNWNVNNVTISSTDEHEKNDHKGKKKESLLAFEKNVDEKSTTNDVPLGLMYKKTAITPMTKEEWDKKQSVVRRVYDEETGRHRLIKGDGEVLEEIISKERHKEINRQATIGDGEYFSKKISQSVK